MATGRHVSVETLVHSLKQDRLIGAAQSDTTNPDKVGPFIEELVSKAAAEMKQGLIRAPRVDYCPLGKVGLR